MPFPANLMKSSDTSFLAINDTGSINFNESTGYLYPEMNHDKRKDKRFSVEEGTYLVIESSAPQIFSIINMGAGGISYTYFKSEEHETARAGTFDILVLGNGFCLEKIPFTTVSDFKASDDIGAGNMEKRVACIEFRGLTEKQEIGILNFINNYIDKSVN